MKRAALLAVFVFFATDAASEEREPVQPMEPLLADIARARKDVKTLKASFRQERRISLLATTVKSTGELSFGAPDRLRWDLAPPDDVVYFVGPEGLAYKTKTSSAALPPGKDANVARALADVRALLGGDLAPLKAHYTLSASRTANDVEIDGIALDKTASVRSFALVMEKGLVIPIRAHLVEGKSDGIDLVFSNVVVNGAIDPARLKP